MKHSLISCSCKRRLGMMGSSKSSALVCFWSDFAGNYPALNSKISHFTFMPAGNLTAWSQREFSFPRHRHLRLTLCHQTSFTLWDQTRHLIASHQFMAELGCELIICSIVRLRGLPGGLFFFFFSLERSEHKKSLWPADERGLQASVMAALASI